MAFAFYQEGGAPIYYFYETNLQGDIINIYDENGSKIVSFRYDAWGNFNTDKANTTICTDTFLKASLFRYRSYIYDYESNRYYLQSRYYDPETGRFVNADGYVSTGQGLLGNNMYMYCLNNPINKVDYLGNKPGDLFDTIDEAAIDFAMCYNQKSINEKQEYGSAIYMVIQKKITPQKTPWYFMVWGIRIAPITTMTIKYSYTKPAVGKNGNTVLPNLFTVHQIVSTVHTHGNHDPKYDNENFSDGFFGDIWWSNLFRMNSYLVTPGGHLKKYTYKNRNNANKGVTEIPCDIPWDPNSPFH